MSRKKCPKGKRSNGLTPRSRPSHQPTNQERLVHLLEWFLVGDGIFAELKFHGNTKWLPRSLVYLALFWSWSEHRHLTDAFVEAAGYCQQISGTLGLGTYQGFMGALVTWTCPLISVLCRLLYRRLEQVGGKLWRVGKWVPIAFDGSRTTVPRTEANEKAFCAPRYGKGQTAKYRKKKSKGLRRKRNQQSRPQPQAPQVWITMVWHMGLLIPLMWRLGPSNSSERAHVMDMVETGNFPENTLFCGDAGFVGYPLWSEIMNQGADFLVRVGANVNLLMESAEYSLQPNGLVWCWPDAAQRKNKPPLRLRLVQVSLGKTKAWLLTSVLEADELTPQEMLRLYKMRWGIEVEFRGLKQILNRAKLRCRNDQRVLAELHWSILGMAIAELFALKEQLSKKRPHAGHDESLLDPSKRSLAQTMRVLRRCLRHLDAVPEQDLLAALRNAVIDSYQRQAPKRARYRPPNPDKKPLGDPKLRPLNSQEYKQLAQFAERVAA